MLQTLKIAALLGVLAIAGCANKVNNLSEGGVVSVSSKDAAMNAAMVKGKASLPQFVAALKAAKASQSKFAVYARFKEAGKVEYLWIDPVVTEGADFRGVVANKPDMLKKVKSGDRILVPAADVADWMYVENGKLVGAQTTRVLRDQLSADERADFDKSMPYSFD